MFRDLSSRLGAVLALALLCGLGAARPAEAQIGSDRYSAIVVEARSGNALIAASPDEPRYPASLTKMMTVYLAFEALRDGRLGLSTPIRVSYEAASKPPSRLGLVAGMTLTAEEAILALVTKSANDAAAALGEYLGGGSEQRFAQMMTLKARALGMSRTTFRNASGLPDLEQVSTARDMALLGRRLLQDFPDRYAYFSTPYFVFRGRTHFNHNRLLAEYDGTDGIKTGYVNDSGFNLVASVQRDGVRLVATVFGGRSSRERDRHMMALLDQGFAQMGVAPEPRGTAMARAAPRGVLVGQAEAAPRRAVRPPVPVAHRPHRTTAAAAKATARRPTPQAQAASRATLLRVTAGRPARVEQGDARVSRPSRAEPRRPAQTRTARR
ncbi:D-alanyl-D-alanine carboxypeptidase family protein [Siccirubricoccus phaeus]|uniref:D-alanyl-D-alanine carboxypeptidase family protein n=1 Tax=Siccirubricoccus phaeus TaxID=2595053 RepID=UPI001A9C91ED|nr:D-alanyl-D-alanine carboxypeptidase family protein [Siccirubricoccus phaeus]